MAITLSHKGWQQSEPNTNKAFFLSLLAHSLLALMFSVGLQWKTSSTPAGVEVELWDNTPPPPPSIEPQVEAPPLVQAINEKAEIVTTKKVIEPKEEPKKLESKILPTPKPIEKPKIELRPEPKKEEPKPIVKPKVELKPPPPLPKPVVKPKIEPKKEEAKPNLVTKPTPLPKQPNKASSTEANQKISEEKDRIERLAKLRASAELESGGSGGTTGLGTGSGGVASPAYADKVTRAVKPWINYGGASQIDGNPATQVSIELAPDGRILHKQLKKSSGIADWDAAVLRAIDATGTIPKDENGTVPKFMVLIFKPKG